MGAYQDSDEDRAEIQKRWDAIDIAGKGTISLQQLKDFGGSFDYSVFATEEGRSLFAGADIDGDGRIDLTGFTKLVHVRVDPRHPTQPTAKQFASPSPHRTPAFSTPWLWTVPRRTSK